MGLSIAGPSPEAPHLLFDTKRKATLVGLGGVRLNIDGKGCHAEGGRTQGFRA